MKDEDVIAYDCGRVFFVEEEDRLAPDIQTFYGILRENDFAYDERSNILWEWTSEGFVDVAKNQLTSNERDAYEDRIDSAYNEREDEVCDLQQRLREAQAELKEAKTMLKALQPVPRVVRMIRRSLTV